jgi:methyl-accepting chemotaxis protein
MPWVEPIALEQNPQHQATKMNLNVKFLIKANAALLTVALVGEVALLTILTRPIWINQQLYTNIVDHHDLTADIEPPPFLLRSLRGEVARALLSIKNSGQTEPAQIATNPAIMILEQYYGNTVTKFRDRQQFWLENPNLGTNLQNKFRSWTSGPSQEYLNAIGNNLIPALQAGNLKRATVIDRNLDAIYQEHFSAVDGMIAANKAEIKEKETEADNGIRAATLWIIFSTLALLGLGYFTLYLMQKVAVTPLSKIAGELGDGADQFIEATSSVANASYEIATGARQVANSSQQMAQGASEQAAAIEETSASLEQMSSMIHSSARNADHAKTLAGEAQALQS